MSIRENSQFVIRSIDIKDSLGFEEKYPQIASTFCRLIIPIFQTLWVSYLRPFYLIYYLVE